MPVNDFLMHCCDLPAIFEKRTLFNSRPDDDTGDFCPAVHAQQDRPLLLAVPARWSTGTLAFTDSLSKFAASLDHLRRIHNQISRHLDAERSRLTEVQNQVHPLGELNRHAGGVLTSEHPRS